MFTLLKKIILLFSLFFIINLLSLSYLNHFDIYYPPFKKKFQFYTKNHTYENYMLGDSRIEAAIIPSLFDKSSVNLGFSGFGIYGATKALLMSDIPLKDRNVIVGVGVLNLNDRRIKKRFLALFDDFLNQSWTFIFKNWGRHSVENLNAVYACKFFSCPFFDDLPQNYVMHEKGFRPRTETMNANAEEQKSFLDRYDVYFHDFSLQGNLYAAFKQSVQLLRKKGAKVYVVLLPNAPSYRNILRSKGREEDFNRFVSDTEAFSRDENVRFLNFVDRQDLFKIDDFADVMHLNEQGAVKFSKLLNKQLMSTTSY